ncbi:hypothetical protein [Veronia nyctiphanis]|uniref:hypothetical protein n=1 Tax=Veronia nyctiphanis TaxID=1278244 RepID=UPI0038B6A4FE
MNANEAAQDQTVSGTVSGEFNANDAVTVSVGNHTYSANVDEDGYFSVTVPGSVLATNSGVDVAWWCRITLAIPRRLTTHCHTTLTLTPQR